ncbi:MAG: efflux RND transporter periplasmic adaptor subunit [Bacteroidota bacterium]|nr:efflux RND transporter periplasmic adaptor subunit [Bacteroidota bacterium]
MQNIARIILIAASFSLAACAAKNADADLKEKKAKLEELKKQQAQLNDDVVKLEAEIIQADPSSKKEEKAKLVLLNTITPQQFTHYIDIQGKIDAVNVAYVAPRNGSGGLVKELFVKKGDHVKKGQLLLKLDDAIIKKQLDQLQTQLSFAKDLYQRQQNLWKENIGTEVQLISAKNNVDNIQKQISLVKEQQSFTNVTADIDGELDDVNIRVGELFVGATVAGAQIKIVNTQNMKVVAQIPENYLGKVNVGSKIKITLPDINKTINAVISVAGKLIDANSRSFYVEAEVAPDKDLRPNQIALLQIQDYAAASAITVPVNTLQTDEKGKFVMVAVNTNGKLTAHKKAVVIGELYGDKIEIKSGLDKGDQLIVDGFQSLYEGQLLTTDVK